jgi:hypothetical protein
VGFLNGRCWTQLEKGGSLWTALGLDRQYTVARCAVLCLGRRLKTLVILVNGSPLLLVNHSRDDLVTGGNH